MKQLVVALICAVFTLSTVYAQDAKRKKTPLLSSLKGWNVPIARKK